MGREPSRIRFGGAAGLVALTVVVVAVIVPSVAMAAVGVTRAELIGTSLRVDGRGARVNANVTVSSPESSATGRADGAGRFKVTASGFRSSTCRVSVGDGSTTVVATLTGCTPTAPAAATLSALTIAPTSVAGGGDVIATVTLTGAAPIGGVTVGLSASSTTATVPANVVVTAGSTGTTFAVTTVAVAIAVPVTVTATVGAVSRAATLTVTAPSSVPALSSVSLSHTALGAVGTNAVGQVRLVGLASTPVVVAVTSSHPAIARVSLGTTTEVPSVQVEPGFDQATFLVRQLVAVASPTVVTITASASGVNRTTRLTINPTPGLAVFAPATDMAPGFVGSNFVDTATGIGIGTTLGVSGYVGVVQFAIVAGQLPAGLTLVNPGAGGATPDFPPMRSVTGEPTTVQTTTFTLRATDSANGATATIVVTITINPALGISLTPQLPWSPIVGGFSNLWIIGGGGVLPYTWTRTAGQLPPGMPLVQDNRNGPLVRVTGTPTMAGTYNFTLRITDAQGTVGSQTFVLVVG